MHLRFSIAKGTPVVDDESSRIIAKISGILINPDNGKIAGFFVRSPGLGGAPGLFLSSSDIRAWGTVIHVRNTDALVPPEDVVRIASLMKEPRTIIRQPIITRERGTYMGVCKDVQFDTRHLSVEWLFPCKMLFFTGNPIPASEITEVTRREIIIKEPLKSIPEKADEVEGLPKISEVLPTASASSGRI